MLFPFLFALLITDPSPIPNVATHSQVIPGTITVEQGEGRPSDERTDQAFADAVQHAMLRTNFVPLPAPSHSRYIATVYVSRHDRGMVPSGVKGSGPAAGIGNWGAGVRLGLPTKKHLLRNLVLTTLEITVMLRSTKDVVWSGNAMTVQVDGTRNGASEVVAEKLAEALIAQFPNRLESPISVP
jgi:hypothetical protein